MREEKLLNYLKTSCHGRENRKSGRELARTLGIHVKDLQKLVKRLRKKKKPIASDQYGYYYVIISYGYDDRIIDLYKDDFFIISLKRTNPLSQTEGSTFRELIITNYDPSPYLNKQLDIFGQATEAMWEPVILHRPRRILKAD